MLDVASNLAQRVMPRPNATGPGAGGPIGLPAAKHFDPVIGVDVHYEITPPVIPVRHPFIGFLFDPFDYIPFIGATVYVNGVPRAQAGTAGLRMPPHTPLIGPFVKPPENECEMFMGSMTVAVDSDAFSYMALPALSCNDIGFSAPPRKKSPPVKARVLPTSLVIAIPMGPPVFVGGPPTISLMALGMRAGVFLLGKGLGKLAKTARARALGKAVEGAAESAASKARSKLAPVTGKLAPVTEKIAWVANKAEAKGKAGVTAFNRRLSDPLNPGLRKKVAAQAELRRKAPSTNKGCGRPGEPVDVVSGANVDELVDFVLPGTPPLPWRRYYDSRLAGETSAAGRGFRFDLQRQLERHDDGFTFVDGEGEPVDLPPLRPGDASVAHDGFRLRRVQGGTDGMRDGEIYEIDGPDGTMRFAPVRGNAPTPMTHWHTEGSTWTLRYDDGRPQALEDDTGRRLALRYDALGHLIEVVDACDPEAPVVLARYRHDPEGRLVAHIDAYGHASMYAYDEAGLMTRKTDRNGYSFHYRYDDRGRCVHSWGDDGMYEIRLRYDDGARETVVTWADGAVWRYRYDHRGAITTIVDPDGWSQRFRVDASGRILQQLDASGNVTTLLYDDADGHYARRDPLGYLAPPIHVEPDPDDPLAYELPDCPLRWCWGDLPLHAWSHDAPDPDHDRLGRVCGQRDESGIERWQYDVDDNVIGHRDRDGRTTHYAYSSWGQLRERHDATGGITRYETDLRENLIAVEDPGGTVHRYAYDDEDRIVEVWRGDELVERYRWDRSGNLVQKLDGNGRPLLDLEAGPGNLVRERRLASGEVQRFEYDAAGRVVLARTETMSIQRRYDPTGRVLADLRDGEGVEHDLVAGRLVASRWFGRFEVRLQHAGDGSVVIEDPLGGRHRIELGPGRCVTRRLGNGSVEHQRYDHRGLCLHSEITTIHDPASRAPWTRRYRYSAHGDLQQVDDSRDGITTYRHDGLHRLAEARPARAPAMHFRWDPADNLLAQPGLHDVEVGPGNRLRRASGESLGYDERHRLHERRGLGTTTRYRYDALDRLVGCDTPQARWSAAYDPLGRRTAKTWEARTTEYYWDDFRLAAERFPEGTLRLYVYPDLTALVPLMFIEYPTTSSDASVGRAYFVFTDQIGAPRCVQDERGRVVWRARMLPFGTIEVDPTSEIALHLRMPGHLHDPETGLHYNRFRYYDPRLGRYLQPDPLGVVGGLNLYAYCPGPLQAVDIDGLVKSHKQSNGGRSPGRNVLGIAHNRKAKLKSSRSKRRKAFVERRDAILEQRAAIARYRRALKEAGKEQELGDLWTEVRQHVHSRRGRWKLLRQWYYDGRAQQYGSPQDLAMALDSASLARAGRQRPAFTDAIIRHLHDTRGGTLHRRHIVMSSTMRQAVYSITDHWPGPPDELLRRYNELIQRAGLNVRHTDVPAAEAELVRVLHNNPANLILDNGAWNSGIGSLANNARNVLRSTSADFEIAYQAFRHDPNTYLDGLVHGFQPSIQREVINDVWKPFAAAHPPQNADEFRALLECIYDNAAVDLMTRHRLSQQQIALLKMHARFDAAELSGNLDELESVARDFIDVGLANPGLPYPDVW